MSLTVPLCPPSAQPSALHTDSINSTADMSWLGNKKVNETNHLPSPGERAPEPTGGPSVRCAGPRRPLQELKAAVQGVRPASGESGFPEDESRGAAVLADISCKGREGLWLGPLKTLSSLWTPWGFAQLLKQLLSVPKGWAVKDSALKLRKSRP